jgi:hypothetical protein
MAQTGGRNYPLMHDMRVIFIRILAGWQAGSARECVGTAYRAGQPSLSGHAPH